MNEGLFSAYSAMPTWQELLTQLKQTGCTALTGTAEGERSFLAAALAHRTGRPVVLISSTELSAQRNAQDINRLFGDCAAMLPLGMYNSAAPPPAMKAPGNGCRY